MRVALVTCEVYDEGTDGTFRDVKSNNGIIVQKSEETNQQFIDRCQDYINKMNAGNSSRYSPVYTWDYISVIDS